MSITIHSIAKEKGYNFRKKVLHSVGWFVSEKYKHDQGAFPPKVEEVQETGVYDVNCYPESYREFIENALKHWADKGECRNQNPPKAKRKRRRVKGVGVKVLR